MTDSFSSYPEDMKLSLHIVAAWENYVQKVISAYSDTDTAIRKNIPFVLQAQRQRRALRQVRIM
jgi:hypothetical protein